MNAAVKPYKETFRLISVDVVNNTVDAVVSAYENLDNPLVIIRDADEIRSAAQNRLFHMWMGDIATALVGTGHGLNKKAWKRFYKDNYVRTLLLEQDEKFQFYENKFLEYEQKFYDDKFVRNLLIDQCFHTSDLSVKSYAKLLDEVYHHATSPFEEDIRTGLGITLRVPDDLKWLEVRNAA